MWTGTLESGAVMNASTPAPAPLSPATGPSWAEWTALAAVVIPAVLVGAGRLPQQAKVPVLLPVGLAALLGWGLGELAERWRLTVPRRVASTVAVLVAAALVGNAWDTHRRLAAFIGQQPPPAVPEIAGMDEGLQELLLREKEGTGEESASTRELRQALAAQERRRTELLAEREFRQTFPGYLAFRIPREWGRWPWLAAALFWLAEVVVAALVAGTVAKSRLGVNFARADSPPT